MKNFFKKNKTVKNNDAETAEGEALTLGGEQPAQNTGEQPAQSGGVATAAGGGFFKKLFSNRRRLTAIIGAAAAFVCCLVVAIVLIVCLGGGQYFKLTYELTDAVKIKIISEGGEGFRSGWEVLSGSDVEFVLVLDEKALGEPTVYKNNSELTADGEGVYSFSMTEETVIRVEGVYLTLNYDVVYDDGGDGWIRYASVENPEAQPVVSTPITAMQAIPASGGDKLSFTVAVSVYYKQSGYSVVANSIILKPDDNGVYTFTVTGNTTVSVRELELEDSFAGRFDEDGNDLGMDGSGTEADPYRIRKPYDLYMMANLIGDDFYAGNGFYAAYYRLENDIDMKGEQLFIIGDGWTTSTSSFLGNFDGGNHTISNYYIKDNIVEQSGYSTVFMPYLGMFGLAQASMSRPAEIYDLHLENFRIEISSASAESSFYAGGIVGMGVGVNITNCSAKGVISAVASQDYTGYIGGIIGAQQSASNGTISYASTVRSCQSDVKIAGNAGFIYAAGGVTGYLGSYDERTPAYVLNSYSTGDVYGAINSGGVVGMITPYGSVKNCYATGDVEARSSERRYGNERFHYAYGGGLVGYADYGAVISDSFAVNDVYANAAAGAAYERVGGVVGAVNTSGIPVYSVPALVLNTYSKADSAQINNDFIKSTLKWDELDWDLSGTYPAINRTIGSKTFTVTIALTGGNKVNSSSTVSLTLNDIYAPMCDLYNGFIVDGKLVRLDEYLDSDSDKRSFGYYFDEALTQKIPCSYVPTENMVIYAGFADYKAVADKYYLQSQNGGAAFVDYINASNVKSLHTPLANDAYVQLFANGEAVYRNGVISHKTTYFYDGNSFVINGLYAVLTESVQTDDNGKQVTSVDASYPTFKAVLDGGVLKIFDGDVYAEAAALTAVREISGFNYGYYYKGTDTYVFNPNLTGQKINGSSAVNFVYSVSGQNITLTGGINESLTRSSLAAYDVYYGVWEKSAGSHKQFTFDGKGGWKYEYFGYDSNGVKKPIETLSGTYTATASTLTATGGKTFAVSIVGGVLKIDGEAYYKQNSFAGTWRFPNGSEPVEITFNGISAAGYGTAFVAYPSNESAEVEYHAVSAADGTVSIELYNSDFRFGHLTYSPAEKTLSGSIYSVDDNDLRNNAKFFLYDDFRGEWVSSEAGLEIVNFNGFGNYEDGGSANHMATSGSVTIKGVDAGSYRLVDGTLKGSFEYDGITYAIEYDEVNKLIVVKYTDASSASHTVQLVGYDGWQSVQLTDYAGNEYTFDGKSKIGGTLTVTDTVQGTKTTYGYTVNADGSLKVGSSGNLTPADGKYTYSIGSSSGDLWIKNGLTGDWLYKEPATGEVEKLNVSKIGPGSSGYKVSFKYGDEVVLDAVYNLSTEEISFVNTDVGFAAYLSVLNGTEISFTLQYSGFIYNYVCLSALDGYEGDYVSANGKITLDGFGVTQFATGTATLYEGEDVASTYTYSMNSFDTLEFVSGSYKYVFEEVSSEHSGAYEKDGKYYALRRIDALYNISAIAKNSNNTTNANITYAFDGAGTIVYKNGAVTRNYSYEILSYSRLMMMYTLKVSDGSKIYEGELNLSTDATLKLTEKDALYGITAYGVDNNGETDTATQFRFDGAGTVTSTKGENTVAYTYSNIKISGQVYTVNVTGPDSKQYTGTLTLGEVNTFKLEEKAA